MDDLRRPGARFDSAPPGSTRWTVEFSKPDRRIEVRERFVGVDRPLTCAARPAGRIRVLDPLDVRM